VKLLEGTDAHHLRSAQGWLELGNHFEANEELEQIAPENRAHPAVLELRWQIYAREKKWSACVDIAEALVKLVPNESNSWIHRSFSLHEFKKTQEAFDKLLPAVNQFPDLWDIAYNLSCYAAQLGRLEECEKWFKKAMTLNENEVKRLAVDDPDLKPFWDSMSGTLWKRTPSGQED
jgi:tetratricopeptide (TPR) repeat protein